MLQKTTRRRYVVPGLHIKYLPIINILEYLREPTYTYLFSPLSAKWMSLKSIFIVGIETTEWTFSEVWTSWISYFRSMTDAQQVPWTSCDIWHEVNWKGRRTDRQRIFFSGQHYKNIRTTGMKTSAVCSTKMQHNIIVTLFSLMTRAVDWWDGIWI